VGRHVCPRTVVSVSWYYTNPNSLVQSGPHHHLIENCITFSTNQSVNAGLGYSPHHIIFGVSEWVSDCCFSAISWRAQVNFEWDDSEVRFVLDQHAELDFYSASSLKQQPPIYIYFVIGLSHPPSPSFLLSIFICWLACNFSSLICVKYLPQPTKNESIR
jgi:hypothetical protein